MKKVHVHYNDNTQLPKYNQPEQPIIKKNQKVLGCIELSKFSDGYDAIGVHKWCYASEVFLLKSIGKHI